MHLSCPLVKVSVLSYYAVEKHGGTNESEWLVEVSEGQV